MDRYYNNNRRSRSPPSQNRSNSSRNIGNKLNIKNNIPANFEKNIQDLPEYIPLSSNSQDSKRHSDNDRNGRSPPNRRNMERSNRGRESPPPKQQYHRRISPPKRVTPPPPRERDRRSREKESRKIVYDNDSRSSSTCSSRNRNHQRSRSPVINQLNNPNNHNQRQRSRTNSLERSNRSVFSRLGSEVSNGSSYATNDAAPSVQTQYFRYEDNLRSMEHAKDYQIDNYYGRPPPYRREEATDVRIIVHNDQRNAFSAQSIPHHHQQPKESEEIIGAIRVLEQENEKNYQHIMGIKMTVENYQREISKLEMIVHQTSKEVDRLKNLVAPRDIPLPPNDYNF